MGISIGDIELATQAELNELLNSLTGIGETLSGALGNVNNILEQIQNFALKAECEALSISISEAVQQISEISSELNFASQAVTELQQQMTTKQSTIEKNQANGYCGLGADGKVSSNQLPDITLPSTIKITSTNTAIGENALNPSTTANSSTAVGAGAMQNNTSGNYNTAVGKEALKNNTTGTENVAIGKDALQSNIGGNYNTVIGTGAMQSNTSGSFNIAIGRGALPSITTANYLIAIGISALMSNTTGSDNVAVGGSTLRANTIGILNSAFGNNALYSNTEGHRNTASGYNALYSNTTGTDLAAFGFGALNSNTTGNYNSGIGRDAGRFKQDGTTMTNLSNVTCLGYNSRSSGNNQVQLGDANTTTYAYGAVQNRSDARDKTDIQNTQLGLDFIMALTPREFRWDYRDDYFDKVDVVMGQDDEGNDIIENLLIPVEKDGSRKRNRLHQGFIAQEVKAVMDSMEIDFAGYQDHKVNGGCDAMSLGYIEFIAPMVKAIQQQQAMIEQLKSRIEILEN